MRTGSLYFCVHDNINAHNTSTITNHIIKFKCIINTKKKFFLRIFAHSFAQYMLLLYISLKPILSYSILSIFFFLRAHIRVNQIEPYFFFITVCVSLHLCNEIKRLFSLVCFSIKIVWIIIYIYILAIISYTLMCFINIM